jgi:hypothetical protein
MNVTDCLEGRGRTPEQMAADYRALQAAAPTPADKFALMFGHPRPTPRTDACATFDSIELCETLERELAELEERREKVLDILAEVLDDWRAGLNPNETPSCQRAAALISQRP